MNKSIPILAMFLGAFPLQSAAQDAETEKKWSKAKVVKWHVVGVFKDRVQVGPGDMGSKGDVTDRITVEYTWDQKGRKLIGEPKVTDGAAEVTNLKTEGTNCAPPQLKGPYEHFQFTSVQMMGKDLIELKGTRNFPPAMISNYPASCSLSPAKGKTEPVTIHVVAGMHPKNLAAPHMPGAVTIAPDRKSFSMAGTKGWVWTYTPTLVE